MIWGVPYYFLSLTPLPTAHLNAKLLKNQQ